MTGYACQRKQLHISEPATLATVTERRRRRHSALGWLSPLQFEDQSKIVAV